jgi:hypothetical protein
MLPPEKAQPVKLTLFTKSPVIDGKLDDDVWKSAAVFKDFYQWRPSDTGTASARTEVFAGYDSRFIYFAFHAYDDPAKVRASVAKRDSIFDDDSVGLLIDTFNDKRRAYESSTSMVNKIHGCLYPKTSLACSARRATSPVWKEFQLSARWS